MPPFRLTISAGKFRDGRGRHVVLRGINVAGDAKLPSEPDQPSHEPKDFFDGDNVRFHARPFPVADAPLHFSRLKRYGYNTIRYIFTWEALEAAGPGRYDEDWIRHTIEVLRVAKNYGFYVFMDPHQDVWSRFTGGSGAPMWTLYACGLNPQSFAATEAALVHNTYPDPPSMTKMIWATNYFRLACATVFTLFYAGRDFAPRCVLDGVNIQDYLQTHFNAACAHLARRIREAGDLERSVVVGWESLNEPNPGLIGCPDLTVIPASQQLKKGTSPTGWQAMLTGMGRPCEVETWDLGGMGPYRVGRKLVDPHGERAWLPEDYDDSRYGWKRGPDWKLGTCLWAQHGVWDLETDTLLRRDYFYRQPATGQPVNHDLFNQTYFMHNYRGWRDAVRGQHPDALLLLQSPTLQLPPRIKGTDDDDPMMGFVPHWYDGITLMTKHFNRNWNVDVVGVLRGRYWHPVFAIRVGESAIRACFRDQMAALRQEGLDRVGDHPVVMTEFGVPYDMDNRAAYSTGDYSNQSAAMDANYFAAEASGLEGHCVWVYAPTNSHQHGDRWNGEDLSIVSVDDHVLPVSPVPRGGADDAANGSAAVAASSSPRMSFDVADETTVTPENLHKTLTNPSISDGSPASPMTTTMMTTTTTGGKLPLSPLSPSSPSLSLSGLRAAEAYVRPAPLAVAGTAKSYGFDLRTCTFSLTVAAPAPASEDAPTVVYLPEFHFPRDACEVTASSGRWEISVADDEVGAGVAGADGDGAVEGTNGMGDGVLVQRLRWWHLGGAEGVEAEQTIKIRGVARRGVNVPSGSETEEGGYLEQCMRLGGGWIGGGSSGDAAGPTCSVM